MKKTQIIIVLAVSMLILSSCGLSQGEEVANTTVVKGSAVIDEKKDSSSEAVVYESIEKTANIIDEVWLKKYDKEFMKSEEYNPLFSERCFYVKGVRVHIPTTVRGFEKLFGTTFTTAMHGGYYSVYKDDNDIVLQVEFIREDREKYSGDSDYDEKMKDMPIIGFYYDDTPYGKDHCILNVNNVSFEEVSWEGYSCENEFGYYSSMNIGDEDTKIFRFYPDCYQAYYLLLNGRLPIEFIENGLDQVLSEAADVRYGDVTLDALDEMFYFTENTVDVITYDKIDRKLRLLYRTEEKDRISTSDGILIYDYDPKGFQDYYELTKYYVFNRYGKKWELAELERWQDENYNTHHIMNGEEVDEDTFIDAKSLYGHPGAFDGQGIELTVWGFENKNGNFKRIMSHKEKLNLNAVGYDADAKPDSEIDNEGNDEILDGDYDNLRAALIEAGFDVDTYGLSEFDVVVSAPDGYVNVREGCGTEYPVVAQIFNGTEVYIGECFINLEGQLWGAITEPEFLGYIALSQVQQIKR